MPYRGYNWPNTDPASILSYTYDFSSTIPQEEVITSVEWELSVAPDSVYTGVDPTPQSRIMPNMSSHSDHLAAAWLGNLQANTRYKLTSFVTTNTGRKDSLFAYIRVDPRP